MENDKIVKKFYKESVKGINEAILSDKDLWYSYVITLPDNLRIVYTVVTFHQQVMNGGLHQYFFNPYGQFVFLAIAGLNRIKAVQACEILKKALREVNSDRLDEDEFRAKIFDRKLERVVNFNETLFSFLDKLDDEYYTLNENLMNLMADYLKNHL